MRVNLTYYINIVLINIKKNIINVKKIIHRYKIRLYIMLIEKKKTGFNFVLFLFFYRLHWSL